MKPENASRDKLRQIEAKEFNLKVEGFILAWQWDLQNHVRCVIW